VTKKREVTTTTAYACIDHKVRVESTTVTPGPWTEEKYCMAYAPYRCADDLLTELQARGRYNWMKKCAPVSPMIKQILDTFDWSKGKNQDLTHKGNIIYASFMDSATTPHRLWVAPRTSGASCNIPSTVYISAVCVLDCATPEQQV